MSCLPQIIRGNHYGKIRQRAYAAKECHLDAIVRQLLEWTAEMPDSLNEVESMLTLIRKKSLTLQIIFLIIDTI